MKGFRGSRQLLGFDLQWRLYFMDLAIAALVFGTVLYLFTRDVFKA